MSIMTIYVYQSIYQKATISKMVDEWSQLVFCVTKNDNKTIALELSWAILALAAAWHNVDHDGYKNESKRKFFNDRVVGFWTAR